MGTSSKRGDESTLDGDFEPQTEAMPPTRSDNFYLDAERIQSGGLRDDPTASGAPVKNRRSFKSLKGGSR